MDWSPVDAAVREALAPGPGRGMGGRVWPGRRVVWRIGAPLAAAAGLALAAWIAWPQATGPGGAVALDRARPVTILDAFKLAKLIERREAGGTGGAGPAISSTWDVTGDGVIDRRDVEALAARAVQLTSRGGSAGPGAGSAMRPGAAGAGAEREGVTLGGQQGDRTPAPHPAGGPA